MSEVARQEIDIWVNGKKRQVNTGTSLATILQELEINVGSVVLELNRQIIPRQAIQNTVLNENDQLEIVHFVGGGSE